MTSITSLTLDAADPAGAEDFYRATFGRHTDPDGFAWQVEDAAAPAADPMAMAGAR